MTCQSKFILICLVLSLAFPILSLVAYYFSQILGIQGLVFASVIVVILGALASISTIRGIANLMDE